MVLLGSDLCGKEVQMATHVAAKPTGVAVFGVRRVAVASKATEVASHG